MRAALPEASTTAASKQARRLTRFCTVALAALISAGCDSKPQLVPAGGTVTYQQKPVPEADVIFVPDAGGAPVIGRTDGQGRFTLTTDGQPGAFPGSYQIGITAVRQLRKVSDAEAASMTTEQIYANHEWVIPKKYNNLISSGLTATVTEDPAKNQFTFDLK
jgi:hypothetical protein